MNLDQLKKSVGFRVQLVPIACRLDEHGFELPQIDDDWIIEDASPAGARIRNTRTDHVTVLAPDHIHHYTSNPGRSRGGLTYGFFTLLIQIYLQGPNLRITPNPKPGERVPPNVPQIVEKWVDLNYAFDSGLLKKLQDEGYAVRWAIDKHLARALDLDGWQIVIEPDQGVLTKFRVRDRGGDHHTLLKRPA
jgi:hypothetical protein